MKMIAMINIVAEKHLHLAATLIFVALERYIWKWVDMNKALNYLKYRVGQ